MSLSVKNMLGGGSAKGLYVWKRRKAKALYLNGDECTDVTGGWSIGVHSVSDGLGEVTKNDTYVYLKTGSSAATDDCPIATNNPIDMNGYDNLCFKYENASGDGNMPVMWAVASSIRGISVKGFSDVTRSGSGENARGITSHIIKTNISSINSPLYAVGGISSSADSFPNGTANMVQAWIESSEEEYIADNNPDKYPDGAVHTDGYYYEKVVEVKISTGSITNSNSSLENLVIKHGLGKTPTKFIVMADLSYSGTSGTAGAFYNVFPSNEVIYYDYGICGESSDFIVNDTTVTVKAMTNMGKYWANKTYYWIAIA